MGTPAFPPPSSRGVDRSPAAPGHRGSQARVTQTWSIGRPPRVPPPLPPPAPARWAVLPGELGTHTVTKAPSLRPTWREKALAGRSHLPPRPGGVHAAGPPGEGSPGRSAAACHGDVTVTRPPARSGAGQGTQGLGTRASPGPRGLCSWGDPHVTDTAARGDQARDVSECWVLGFRLYEGCLPASRPAQWPGSHPTGHAGRGGALPAGPTSEGVPQGRGRREPRDAPAWT